MGVPAVRHATLGVTAIPRTTPPTRTVRDGTLPAPAVRHATATAGLVPHTTVGVTAIPRTNAATRAVRGGTLPAPAVRGSRTRAVCGGQPLIAAQAVRPGRPLVAEPPGRRLMAHVRAREGRVAVPLPGSVRRRLLRPALGRYAGGVRA
ncbi:hypothetical protein ACGFXB_29360 [Streptomyces canus]|uniref:hypothetical protein n=1 Tax=Streptomyces canus TaxID=58343 RepID=UPI00371AB7E9